MAAQRMGGPVGFGGERQWLQLLCVGRGVAVGGVCVLGVCGGWSGGRGQCCSGGCWGVQGGGGARLRQVGVCQVGDGVWLCEVRAYV